MINSFKTLIGALKRKAKYRLYHRVSTLFPAGHFYSPIVDPSDLKARKERIWRQSEFIPGIEWPNDAQLELLADFEKYSASIDFPLEREGIRYFYRNDQFPVLDAEVLFCMLCRYRPGRMVEIGSGYSSLVTAEVNRNILGSNLDFSCIEPYPKPFLAKGVNGITRLVTRKVEDVEIDFFSNLKENDILFIDSSHVAKTGSDVNYLFFEVIPRLNKGVLIHVHDIFLPDEYPEKWVIDDCRNWNEQYLLRAFLQFNPAFEILWGSHYMATRHRSKVHEIFPRFPELGSGGSLWMRKIS